MTVIDQQRYYKHGVLILFKEPVKYMQIVHLTKEVSAMILVYDIMFSQRSCFIAIKNACQKLKMQHCFCETSWKKKGDDAYICSIPGTLCFWIKI